MSSNAECSSMYAKGLIKPKCEGVDEKQMELHEVKRNKSSNKNFIAKVHRASSFSHDKEDKDVYVDAGLFFENGELCCYSCDVKVKPDECNKPFDVHHESCLHSKIKQMDGCETENDFLKIEPEVDHKCLKCKTKWRVILYMGCGHLVLCTDCFLEELHSEPEPGTDSDAQEDSLPERAKSALSFNSTEESANGYIVCPLQNCQKQSFYYKRVIRG